MRTAIVMLVIALAGCRAQKRGEPSGPPVVPDTAAEIRGERLFHKFCYQCHPGGEAGLGPGINDKPLPKLAIRTQIRQGVGEMPAFSDDQLSDSEVGAIIEYLEDMRKTPTSHD